MDYAIKLTHLDPEMLAKHLYPDLTADDWRVAVKLDEVLRAALAATDVTVTVSDEMMPGLTREIIARVMARINIAVRTNCKFDSNKPD